jgi:peptide/nickel transport system substrate-binding protein
MKKKSIFGAIGLSIVASVLVASCGSSNSGGGPAGSPKKGGTVHILTLGEQIAHLDPQRNYTGTDMAFAVSTMHRTLTSYKYAEGDAGSEIVADLATDIGTVTNEGKTWAFTLADGGTFEDGSAITCADVAYGVSRTFATDVITDGPSYAMSYIDVAEYPGPYTATADQQAAFDKAVNCVDKTITFNLKVPVADFNYTTTLTAFSPVPKALDTGENYDMKPVSSGPYKIESYEIGKSLVLVRNDKWDQASDPIRHAYADSFVYEFGLDSSVIDERMIKDAGDDQFAVSEGIQPENLQTIFEDDAFKDRRVDYYDPFVSYTNVNVKSVPCLDVRKAVYLALDRDALRKAGGGPYTGDYADGFIKPALAADYAKSKMLEGLNEDGTPNVEAAKAAMEAAKTSCPEVAQHAADGLVYPYPDTPVWAKAIAIWIESQAKAGITIKGEPVEASKYWPTVMAPDAVYDLARGGWAPDWLNASTVIPELFATSGGFNLTHNEADPDYAEFQTGVDAAKVNLDRAAQGKQWQELNQFVVDRLWALPGTFIKSQSIWGSKVGNAYQWGPYGSFNFGELSVNS